MRTRLILLSVLCAALLLAGGEAVASAPVPDDMVRLHIQANSDTALDQLLKLRVRDAIRDCAADIVADAADARSAYDRLCGNRERLREAADMALRVNGSNLRARVETGAFAFPAREYAGHTVPPGIYRAVRVRLGSGEGANWWCVLYPDLCFVDEECAKAARDGGEIYFYSSIVRWLRAWLEGRGAA